ncbi:hypothetical protein FNV43_RR13010 [Rhamnella rubrinervis]|uniref:Retrotransposon gag domain-containing protein n=1 Tax=Rhamnella rubrinervis TaxID=2594499 RepID=A0A8K0H0F4_9ROSA|nr:hypothetical protein FNV43_RR13010 [Rhamnella rubrinervis]
MGKVDLPNLKGTPGPLISCLPAHTMLKSSTTIPRVTGRMDKYIRPNVSGPDSRLPTYLVKAQKISDNSWRRPRKYLTPFSTQISRRSNKSTHFDVVKSHVSTRKYGKQIPWIKNYVHYPTTCEFEPRALGHNANDLPRRSTQEGPKAFLRKPNGRRQKSLGKSYPRVSEGEGTQAPRRKLTRGIRARKGGETPPRNETNTRRGAADPPLKGYIYTIKDQIVDQVLRELKGKTVEEHKSWEPPYNVEIMEAPLLKNFKMSNLVIYNGKGDSNGHLDVFRSWMNFEQNLNLPRCRAFPLTLSRPAQAWHSRLKLTSIHSFEQLAAQFVAHFKGAKLVKKLVTHLMSIRQGHDESLESYRKRLNNEVMLIVDFSEQVGIRAIFNGLRPRAFKWDITKNTLKLYLE